MIKNIIENSEIDVNGFVMPFSIYPYINYSFYNLTNPIFQVYKINNKMFTVHDGTIQLCFLEASLSEIKSIYRFAIANRIKTISGPVNNLEKLKRVGKNDSYVIGKLFEFSFFECNYTEGYIKKALSKDEMFKIASFVCESNKSHNFPYSVNQYFEQINSRLSSGYSRNWMFFYRNQFVGHIATYAESSEYAVLGGLSVLPEYRRIGIAKTLLSNAIKELKSENKKIYAFCFNKALESFYRQISISESDYLKVVLNY